MDKNNEQEQLMFHITNLYLYHKSKSNLLITTIYNNINPFVYVDYSYQMMKCSYPNDSNLQVNPSIENNLQWVFCSYLLWATCKCMKYHAPILSNLKSFQTPCTYYKWFVTISPSIHFSSVCDYFYAPFLSNLKLFQVTCIHFNAPLICFAEHAIISSFVYFKHAHLAIISSYMHAFWETCNYLKLQAPISSDLQL